MNDLVDRFRTFISCWDEFEDIDSLQEFNHKEGMDKADYMIFGRKIIIEQKILQDNPVEKTKNIIRKILSKRGIAFNDDSSLIDLLQNIDKKDDIIYEIWLKVFSRIKTNVSNADKQCRDTKITIGKSDAVGLIALLNPGASLFDPRASSLTLRMILAERNLDGTPRYNHIHGALLISEAHFVQKSGGERQLPIICVHKENAPQGNLLENFFISFGKAWAWFNAMPHSEASIDDLYFEAFDPNVKKFYR